MSRFDQNTFRSRSMRDSGRAAGFLPSPFERSSGGTGCASSPPPTKGPSCWPSIRNLDLRGNGVPRIVGRRGPERDATLRR